MRELLVDSGLVPLEAVKDLFFSPILPDSKVGLYLLIIKIMYKIEITYEEYNIGVKMTKDDEILDWNKLSKEEQWNIMDIFGSAYSFFLNHLKDVDSHLS